MTDDPKRRRVEPRKRKGLYSDEQSRDVKLILSVSDHAAPKAWNSLFEKNDKRVKPADKKNASSVEDTELERLSQTNKLRGPFMYSALVMVATIIIVSSIVVIALTFRGELETPMGVAFSVTLGLEVVGILAIIAHYLFSVPESYLLEKVKQAKEAEENKDGHEIEEAE